MQGWPPPRLASVVNQQVKQAQPVDIEKHPYVQGARVKAEYPDEVKEVIRVYNSLRAKVLEAGLMDDKT